MTTDVALPGFAQNLMPKLPDHIRNVFMGQFVQGMDSLSGGFNRISLMGGKINMYRGKDPVQEGLDSLDVVIIAMAPTDHLNWYRSKYREGQPAEAPAAVWGGDEQAPDIVPASALVKDDDGYFGYHRRRRIVVAPMICDANGVNAPDLENLYALDVPAKSIYGDNKQFRVGNMPMLAFSFRNYIGLIKSSGLFPAAFVTTLRPSAIGGITLHFTMPMTAGGDPVYMTMETLTKISVAIQSTEVKDLLDWRRALSADTGDAAPQQQQQQQQAPQQYQQQQQQQQQQAPQQYQQAQQQPAPTYDTSLMDAANAVNQTQQTQHQTSLQNSQPYDAAPAPAAHELDPAQSQVAQNTSRLVGAMQQSYAMATSDTDIQGAVSGL